jgi:hypothetical protein
MLWYKIETLYFLVLFTLSPLIEILKIQPNLSSLFVLPVV